MLAIRRRKWRVLLQVHVVNKEWLPDQTPIEEKEVLSLFRRRVECERDVSGDRITLALELMKIDGQCCVRIFFHLNRTLGRENRRRIVRLILTSAGRLPVLAALIGTCRSAAVIARALRGIRAVGPASLIAAIAVTCRGCRARLFRGLLIAATEHAERAPACTGNKKRRGCKGCREAALRHRGRRHGIHSSKSREPLLASSLPPRYCPDIAAALRRGTYSAMSCRRFATTVVTRMSVGHRNATRARTPAQ